MNTLLEKYLSIVKKCIPEKIVRPSIGLDIGTHTCKAVEIFPSKDSYQILNWRIEPIDPIDPSVTINKFLGSLKGQYNNLSTAISGHGTLTRYINMPKMSLADLRQSVLLEADKHFPFEKDQIYTDCYILGVESQNNTMPVLIAAAKKEIIDKRLQLFSKLGHQLDFIGLNALAMANVFSVIKSGQANDDAAGADGTRGQSDVVAVLDIGHAISSLVILKDAIPCFSRDMFIGARDLTKRISNVLSVDAAEAEKIKCDPQDKIEEILSACDSILMNLVSEIRLSFDYFASEHNAPIAKLLLTGGTSLLKGIEKVFEKNLDIAVEQWNPLERFTVADSAEDGIEQHAARLAVALGLALYRYD